jgi:mono/diheme cytochrome c family protein
MEVLHHVRTGDRRLVRWGAVALTALALAACGREVKRREPGVPIDTAARATIPTVDTAATAAPDTAHALPPAEGAAPTEPAAPVLIASSDSAAGDSVFHGKGRCFTCHGQRGEGTARLGPALTDSTKLGSNGTLAAIRDVIANGVAVPKTASVAMPAYAAVLSPEQIARAAAYVYTLAHPGVVVSDTTAPLAAHADTTTHARASISPPADSTHTRHP